MRKHCVLHSINTRCYLDSRFLQIEREQVFHRSWQFACHEEKLREPNSYIAIDVQGQSVVAIRNQAGELKAYYNVCKHRGHELVFGEGKTKKLTWPLPCVDLTTWMAPWWSRHARSTSRTSTPVRFASSRLQIEVFCHFVFVNLDPDAAPLAEQTGELANEVMSFAPDLADLTFGDQPDLQHQGELEIGGRQFPRVLPLPGSAQGIQLDDRYGYL